MAHTWNPSTQDVVVGASEVQDHLQVHSEVKSNLTCARYYIKKQNKKKSKKEKKKERRLICKLNKNGLSHVITKSSRKTESLTFCS